MYLVWKRRKNLLYLGSVHGGELPEMYGIIGDHVGTDAFGVYTSPRLLPVISATHRDLASELHQPPRSQPPERFYLCQPVVKYHLATIYPGWQEDVLVQRQCHRGVYHHPRYLSRGWDCRNKRGSNGFGSLKDFQINVSLQASPFFHLQDLGSRAVTTFNKLLVWEHMCIPSHTVVSRARSRT